MGEPSTSVERRLAAILAADIVGYSALMGTDEEATVRDLKSLQSVVMPLIAANAGRLVGTAGDSIVAEFASAINAVKCAIAIQRATVERNLTIDPARQMQFRIGINLGDLIVDGANVYGDGINVAARLEAIAEPGGICISEKVFHEMRGKLDIGAVDIGPQSLKNISRPVRVYRLEIGGSPSVVLATAKSSLALPDKPSIAVLPFTNMSGDPSQEYFSDGISEDIITELSRFSDLFVIARNSSFTYKDKAVDVRQVGRELGVRYVLEGSIRRAGDRARITAQLIDAATGAHRWAERYDREVKDIFAVQDEVARTIVSILAAHVNKAEIERMLLRPPASWQAYDYYLQATHLMSNVYSSHCSEDLHEARRLLVSSLAVDPTYARAYAALSFTYTTAYANPFDNDFGSAIAIEQAHKFAQKAVVLDPNLPLAHAQFSMVLSWKRKNDAAVESLEKALAINPNFSDWRFVATLVFAGEQVRALHLSEAYFRCDPFHPSALFVYCGLALYQLKKYPEALVQLRKARLQAPEGRGVHLVLAATYAQSGRLDEAQAEAAEVLRIQPCYTIDAVSRRLMAFKRSEDAEHYIDGLRKAGLPER